MLLDELVGGKARDDQTEGVKSILNRPYVDKDRVGVTGTSYGGYATLMCLFRHPDVFKAGVSNSCVGDWRNYDMEHVNYRPKGMTVEELERGYDELTRRFYSFGSMWRRLSLHRSLPAFGPMNFGFRSALGRKVADA